MKASSMVKGAAMIAALGATAYLYGQASPSTKRKIKRSTNKAIHGIEAAYRRWN